MSGSRMFVLAIATVSCLFACRVDDWSTSSHLHAQEVQQTGSAASLPEASLPDTDLSRVLLSPTAKPHPFAEIVRYAEQRRIQMAAEIRDYTCLLVKRERLHGQLQTHEYIELKVRHQESTGNGLDTPFAVYMKFLGPASEKGREVLYVEGENDGQLIATKGGSGPLAHVTLTLDPTSERAMSRSLHPITEIGILKLAERLVTEGQQQIEADERPEEWEVTRFEKAKIGDRLCKCIQLRRAQRRAADPLHTMRIFVDDEFQTPVRYAMYHWPRVEGTPPELVQEYTYTNLKLNVGLQAADFRRDNAAYRFYQRDEASKTAGADSQ